jgi:hypothetical protein
MAVCSPLHARIDRRLVDDRVDGECVPGLVVSLWPRCQLDLFGDLAAEPLGRSRVPWLCQGLLKVPVRVRSGPRYARACEIVGPVLPATLGPSVVSRGSYHPPA